jgi:hypothetical protein
VNSSTSQLSPRSLAWSALRDETGLTRWYLCASGCHTTFARISKGRHSLDDSSAKYHRSCPKSGLAVIDHRAISAEYSRGVTDEALSTGTKVRVYEPSGCYGEVGVYVRFERRTFGVNSH